MLELLAKLRPKSRSTASSFKKKPLNPRRDWLVGLLLFTLIVSCGSVVSGVLFMQYSTITLSESEVEITMPRYNEVRIDEALAEYAERRQAYDLVVSTVTTASSTPDVVPEDGEVTEMLGDADTSSGSSEPEPEEVPTSTPEPIFD